MKISIIIPVYNAENTIERCVQSFLVQNYSDLELLLIEDHSEDYSYEKCLELKKKYSQVLVFQNEGKGVSSARNLGLSKSTGDIIGFCDSDDTVCNALLHKIHTEFENNSEVSIITFGFNLINVHKKKEIKRVLKYNKNAIWNEQEMIEHVFYDISIKGSVCNKFFKKELIEEVVFDENLTYCEDMYYLINVLSKKEMQNVLILDEALYNYYTNPNSATNIVERLFDESGKIEYIKTFEKIENDFWLSKRAGELLKRAKYTVASDIFVSFRLNKEQKKIVKNCMRENRFYFLKYPFISPVWNVKRIINEFLSWLLYIKDGKNSF